MLYGVKINGVDTLAEYGLALLNDIRVGIPSLKSAYVDIPGADGSLNFSYALTGGPTYNDRQITFGLFKRTDNNALEDIRQTIANLYNGRSVELQLPSAPDFQYTGVMQIGDMAGGDTGRIDVSMTANPWKLKLSDTVVQQDVEETGTVTLTNLRKPVCPKISTTAAITLAWGENSVSLTAGSNWTVDELILQAGTTEISVTGTSTVTFTYREGCL